jgi:hypothetical protein
MRAAPSTKAFVSSAERRDASESSSARAVATRFSNVSRATPSEPSFAYAGSVFDTLAERWPPPSGCNTSAPRCSTVASSSTVAPDR